MEILFKQAKDSLIPNQWVFSFAVLEEKYFHLTFCCQSCAHFLIFSLEILEGEKSDLDKVGIGAAISYFEMWAWFSNCVLIPMFVISWEMLIEAEIDETGDHSAVHMSINL